MYPVLQHRHFHCSSQYYLGGVISNSLLTEKKEGEGVIVSSGEEVGKSVIVAVGVIVGVDVGKGVGEGIGFEVSLPKSSCEINTVESFNKSIILKLASTSLFFLSSGAHTAILEV